MAYKNIIVECDENIGIVTLNRPPANPINYALLDELDKALTHLEEDGAIRVLIITGAGEKGFSAGFDVKTAGTPESASIMPAGQEVFNKIERLSKPVIAAINGFALGGGCELAMACHFRIMVDAERAVIGCPEVNLGIIPGWGGTQRMPRLIGKTKALEMLIFGKRIRAVDALNIGLITKVSQPGELMQDAREFAKALAKQAPLAVKAILNSVIGGLETTTDGGLRKELEYSRRIANTKDALEGMTAFIQKREPNFRGE